MNRTEDREMTTKTYHGPTIAGRIAELETIEQRRRRLSYETALRFADLTASHAKSPTRRAEAAAAAAKLREDYAVVFGG